MKYCPYCGADFADGAASFCMECGKSLPIAEDGQKKPKEKPVKSQKRMEKKRKHPSPKPRKKHEKPVGEHVGGAFHPKEDGYDGYGALSEAEDREHRLNHLHSTFDHSKPKAAAQRKFC